MTLRRVATKDSFGPLHLSVGDDGVGIVVFDRPPVNAVSLEVYGAVSRLANAVERSDAVRVLVLTAPEEARAWCGGADLNEFVGMNSARRHERYAEINAHLPRLHDLEKPVIAAIDGAAVGIGVILAAMCDLRVASETATFSCPEIDYGLVAGGAGLLAGVGFPQAKLREMLYTGVRYTARELESTGFFNRIVPTGTARVEAMGLARLIASKSLPVLTARKRVLTATAGAGWVDAYLLAQDASTRLAANADTGEGVRAFLEHRTPRYADR